MGGGASKGGRREKHFFFGEVLKKKDYGKHMIVVTNPILNKEEYQEWEERYKKSHDMNKETLLIPENFEYKKLQRSVGACNCCGAEGATEVKNLLNNLDDLRRYSVFPAPGNQQPEIQKKLLL